MLLKALQKILNIMSQDNRSDLIKEIYFEPGTGYSVNYQDNTNDFLGKSFEEINTIIGFHREILSPDGIARFIKRIKNIERISLHGKRNKMN